MTQPAEPVLRTVAADLPLARLGPTHGYRFDGDSVHLRATFEHVLPAAHELSWSLQLWACPEVPVSAVRLDGHLVAEAWLPPLAEVDDTTMDFDVLAAATPPAGSAEWVMVLVLASAQEDRFDHIHDFANYPERERFALPRMPGKVGYCIESGRVRLEVEAIENPRSARNISGTLALELWALRAPYTGGNFEGVALAGVSVGTLAGAERWSALEFELPCTMPPNGNWHVVLMLREWVGTAYVTRDYTTFAEPLTLLPAETVAPAPKKNETKIPPAPAEAPKKTSRKSAAAVRTGKVDVNKSSVDEIAAIKGMTRALAEAIVAGRPFGAMEDLLGVRGIGEKRLAGLRGSLTV